MSLSGNNAVQTPQRDGIGTDTPSGAIVLTPSLQETPESQASLDSLDDYGFWDTPDQSNDNVPLTPHTPLSPPTYKEELSAEHTPTSPTSRLRKSKSDCHLSLPPNLASKSEVESTEVKVESNDHQPGWIFGSITRRITPDLSQQPSRPTELSNIAKVESWRATNEKPTPSSFVLSQFRCKIDFDPFVESTPSRKPCAKNPSKDNDNTLAEQSGDSVGLPLSRKKQNVGFDSPPLGPPDDNGRVVEAEGKQLTIKSEVDETVHDETTISAACNGLRQSVSFTQLTQGSAGQTRETVQAYQSEEQLSTKSTIASKALARILPFNIQDRLKLEPNLCVASKVRDSSQRCSKKASGSAQLTTHHLRMLSNSDGTFNLRTALQCINGLVENALCTWHRKCANPELEKWHAKSAEYSNSIEQSEASRLNESSLHLTAFQVWIKALTDERISTCREETNKSAFHKRSSRSQYRIRTSASKTRSVVRTSAVTHRDPESATVTSNVHRYTKFKSSSARYVVQDLVPYRPECRIGWTVDRTMLEALTKPLTPRELEEGFIYIFWYTGSFGYLKIGKTRNIDNRLKAWENKCKHKVGLHFSLTERVPHVYRVEALVQAELCDFRFQEVSCKCGVRHREWFKVSNNHATSVVQRWADWIQGGQYLPEVATKRVGKRAPFTEIQTSEWRLKQRSLGELEVLSQPLLMISSPTSGPSAPRGMDTKRIRHSLRFRGAKTLTKGK